MLGPTEIQAEQDVQINEVATIIEQPPESTAILLRHQRWNRDRLLDRYMEQQEELLDAAGLVGDTKDGRGPHTEKVKGFVCDICCEDEPGLQTYALKCGHRYCVDCYKQYLDSKIRDEGEAARIQCPANGCNRIVDSKSLNFLVEDKLKARYVMKYGGGVGLADREKIPGTTHTNVCGRQGKPQMVSRAQLHLRCGVRY